MVVDVGKTHSERVECGLCEYKDDNMNTLNIYHALIVIYEMKVLTKPSTQILIIQNVVAT